MKKKIGLCLGILVSVFLSIGSVMAATAIAPTAPAVPAASPAGTWQTIDDVSNSPRSRILITINDQHQLVGKLIKINYRPTEGPNDVCAKCTGSLHNQKILGMTILTGMKQDGVNPLIWKGGRIVDPESGKTYDCKITLLQDGNTMKVRGYIGFSLLGRTQIWHRL